MNLSRRVARWWDRLRAPWPIVPECHKASVIGHSCEQCRPAHLHRWRAWPKAPQWVKSGRGIPVRCVVCGARKCDYEGCDSRRHDHTHWDTLRVPSAVKRRGIPS